MMKRTTIFLPEELHESLRRQAFEARVSMAQLIRSRLEESPLPNSARHTTRDVLSAMEGIVSDGTLTQNLDEEIYDL